MAVITLERNHQLSVEELTGILNEMVAKLESKLDVKSYWESERELYFRRSGANGHIEFDDKQLTLTVKLGLMFRALKGPIEKEINEVVDKYLKA